MRSFLALGVVLLISLDAARGASLWEVLGLGGKSTNRPSGRPEVPASALSQTQIIAGLKEALGKGIQQAVNTLGRENGFLTNVNVRIPMPEKLRTVESTLRTLGQERMADDFVRTMNHAAEQAVPQAAGIFADAIKAMSVEDARGILRGTNNAATQYFRRTTGTNLFEKFLPIVKEATGKAGVTASYKRLMDRMGGGNTALGSFGRSLLGAEAFDVDAYVTNKALDGLFTLVAEEEKRIRENPVARTSALLEKVFGAVAK